MYFIHYSKSMSNELIHSSIITTVKESIPLKASSYHTHDVMIGISVAHAIETQQYHLVPFAIMTPYLYLGYNLYSNRHRIFNFLSRKSDMESSI